LRNRNYSGKADLVRRMYAEEGLRGFFKGFGPCMMRAIPVNGGILVVYEAFERKMRGVSGKN